MDKFLFPSFPFGFFPPDLIKLNENIIDVLYVGNFVDCFECFHHCLFGNIEHKHPEFVGFPKKFDLIDLVPVLVEVVEVTVSKVDDEDVEVFLIVFEEFFLQNGEIVLLFLLESLQIIHYFYGILLDLLHFGFDFNLIEDEFPFL